MIEKQVTGHQLLGCFEGGVAVSAYTLGYPSNQVRLNTTQALEGLQACPFSGLNASVGLKGGKNHQQITKIKIWKCANWTGTRTQVSCYPGRRSYHWATEVAQWQIVNQLNLNQSNLQSFLGPTMGPHGYNLPGVKQNNELQVNVAINNKIINYKWM